MSIQKQNYDYLIEPSGNYPSFVPGQGIKGQKGNNGPAGPKGGKGDVGPAGNVGPKGDQGQKGVASSTVFDFQGQVADFATLPTTGNVEGDVYQVLDTQHLYVWDGTQWLLLAGNVNDLKG